MNSNQLAAFSSIFSVDEDIVLAKFDPENFQQFFIYFKSSSKRNKDCQIKWQPDKLEICHMIRPQTQRSKQSKPHLFMDPNQISQKFLMIIRNSLNQICMQ